MRGAEERGVRVRWAVGGDLSAVVEIEEATFSRPWSRDAFAKALDRPEVDMLVATDRGKAVGYMVLVTGAGEAELANLAVSTRFRNRGVGRALLVRAAEILPDQGADFLYLAVRESNEKAIRFYERFGFAEIGTHRSYYRNPSEDARVLALELVRAPRGRGSAG